VLLHTTPFLSPSSRNQALTTQKNQLLKVSRIGLRKEGGRRAIERERIFEPARVEPDLPTAEAEAGRVREDANSNRSVFVASAVDP